MNINVINVFGMSYSGSTLLNFMLDCVTDVYGGGELHWLLTQHDPEANYKAHCTHCKSDCAIWTPEHASSVPSTQFYNFIANLTGCNTIVDTSKNLDWFKQRRRIAEPNVMQSHVLLVKHPYRHLASWLINSKVPKNDKRDAIDNGIKTFDGFYRHVLNYLKQGPFHVVHYEDLILNNLHTINGILSLVDKSHNSSTLDCFNTQHHQIGGNAGPIYLATKQWPDAREKESDIRLRQYESNHGVFIDNKYLDYFTSEELKQIGTDPRIQYWNETFRFVQDESQMLIPKAS